MLTLENVPDNFTWRLVLATLSGRPIKLTQIHPSDTDAGLRDFEVTFLRVLESVTNGSVMEISYTGTTLIYKPGLITGGTFRFECPRSRPVGYFIEPLLCLLPFAKQKSALTFNGVTSAPAGGPGVDCIRTALFPVLQKFGVLEAELQIARRGSLPEGGGEATLRVGTLLLAPKTLHATEQISVNKIRGVAYSTRVAPTSVSRAIDAARARLRAANVDTYIYADAAKGAESGKSPGFGVTLVAETRRALPVAAQAIAAVGDVPEDVGTAAADQLLAEIARRGCVGRVALPLLFVYMTLGSEDVGRALINEQQLDPLLVQLLRDIAAVYPGQHAVFKDADAHGNMLMLVKGTGFVNANKKIS